MKYLYTWFVLHRMINPLMVYLLKTNMLEIIPCSEIIYYQQANFYSYLTKANSNLGFPRSPLESKAVNRNL